MIKKYLPLLFFLSLSNFFFAQSLEIMAGDQRIFADVQWLKFIDTPKQWSIFSRTRATVDYENQTNLFSGAF